MKVKNIVFSGVMAAILGATSANAAVTVASQGYVDSRVDAVETNITNNYLTKEDATNTYLTETQVTQQITKVVGTSENGVLADVAANKTAIAGLQSSKANADDVYTKTKADELLATKADKNQVATDIASAVAGKANTADVYSKTDADSTFATKTALGDVDAKFADYTKTSELNSTFATDAELKAVDDKFANYTTTEGLTTKLADYAKQVDLEAEVTARDTAVKAVDAKLADYTKTSDLDSGFVSEAEMTAFKEANTAAIDAKVAQSDYNTKVSALEAKDTELAGDISDLETALANKITAPAACETQDCVLSINKATGTIAWVPLTEPVANYLNN